MTAPATRTALGTARIEVVELLTSLASGDLRVTSAELAPMLAENWRSSDVAAIATTMWSAMAPGATPAGPPPLPTRQVGRRLTDERGRSFDLVIRFAARSPRVANAMVFPVLSPGVTVRAVLPRDRTALAQLERRSPVRRDDGSEVTIELGDAMFDREPTLSNHWLIGAWSDGALRAVQGVSVVTVTVGDRREVVAHNHYSRSDPSTRRSGNLLHLVARLYFDVFPRIDRYVSFVDPANRVGRRLAFGDPWSRGADRAMLDLARLRQATRPATLSDIDPARVERLVEATHGGNDLRRTGQRGGPTVRLPDGTAWLATGRAALAVWDARERRIYAGPDGEVARRIAVALAYGYAGRRGRDELRGLFAAAAHLPALSGATHLAVFCAPDDPRTSWIVDEADAVDRYLVCGAPVPTLGDRHLSVDPLLF